MKPWELFVLNAVKALAPVAENLFIHSGKSIAIFNASDNVFNGVVDSLNQAQVAKAAVQQGLGSN